MLSTNVILLAIFIIGLIFVYYNKNFREGIDSTGSPVPCPDCCKDVLCTADICNDGSKKWVWNNSRVSTPCADGVCTPNQCCDPVGVCGGPSNKISTICNAPGYTSPPQAPAHPCAAQNCTPEECCLPVGKCSSILCDEAGKEYYYNGNDPPKNTDGTLPKTCTGATCTAEECCDTNPKCASYTSCTNPNMEKDKKKNDHYCRLGKCDDQTCCKLAPPLKWCDQYPCGGGYHKKPDAPACNVNDRDGTCTSEKCCDLNPTCRAPTGEGGFDCQKIGMLAIDPEPTGRCAGSRCLRSECCIPKETDCKDLGPCPPFTHKKSTKPTDCGGAQRSCGPADCCATNPTCKITDCGKGWKLKTSEMGAPAICKGPTCTLEECCYTRGTCSSITCAPGTHKRPDIDHCEYAECFQAECCAPNPSCSEKDCPTGYHPKMPPPPFCKGLDGDPSCTTNECCDPNPRCSANLCPEGTQLTSSTQVCKGLTCTAQECCHENLKCDSLAACPKGWEKKKGADAIVCRKEPCPYTDCCKPIPQHDCNEFACPENTTLMAAVDCGKSLCTDKECCAPNPLPTCFGSTFECPEFYSEKSDTQQIQCSDYECTTEECCNRNPQCSSHACPAVGYSARSPHTVCQGPTCTTQECCIPNATCKAFSCGTEFNKRTGDIVCVGSVCEFEECCSVKPPPPPEKPRRLRKTLAKNYFGGTDVFVFPEDDVMGKEKEGSGKDGKSRYYSDYHKTYNKKINYYPGENLRFDLLTPIAYSDAYMAPLAAGTKPPKDPKPDLARLTFADLK